MNIQPHFIRTGTPTPNSGGIGERGLPGPGVEGNGRHAEQTLVPHPVYSNSSLLFHTFPPGVDDPLQISIF